MDWQFGEYGLPNDMDTLVLFLFFTFQLNIRSSSILFFGCHTNARCGSGTKYYSSFNALHSFCTLVSPLGRVAEATLIDLKTPHGFSKQCLFCRFHTKIKGNPVEDLITSSSPRLSSGLLF